MRKLLLILVLAPLFISCKYRAKGDNGVTYNSPVEYNDYIVGRQTKLMKRILEFGKVAQVDLDSAARLLDTYIKETDEMIGELKGMPPFKKDSSLRNAAIKSFLFYKKVFSEDYKEIISIRQNHGDETEEGVNSMTEIVDRITKQEEKLDKEFHNAQRKFADANKMKLVDNDIQKEIDKAY
jgi:hypothetical protein